MDRPDSRLQLQVDARSSPTRADTRHGVCSTVVLLLTTLKRRVRERCVFGLSSFRRVWSFVYVAPSFRVKDPTGRFLGLSRVFTSTLVRFGYSNSHTHTYILACPSIIIITFVFSFMLIGAPPPEVHG